METARISDTLASIDNLRRGQKSGHLKVQTVCSSEMLASTAEYTRRQNLEEHNGHRHENLKYHIELRELYRTILFILSSIYTTLFHCITVSTDKGI
jgi:hypothetical protein